MGVRIRGVESPFSLSPMVANGTAIINMLARSVGDHHDRPGCHSLAAGPRRRGSLSRGARRRRPEPAEQGDPRMSAQFRP